MNKMLRLMLALALLLSLGGQALAEPIAKIYSLQGTVEVKTATSSWSKGDKGQTLSTNDEIRTGLNSRVGVRFNGGKLVRLRENSHLTLQAPKKVQSEQGTLNLLTGALHLFSRKSKEFPRVETPEVSASIRGTEFVVERTGTTTTVGVLQGAVDLENKFGQVSLGKGEEGRVNRGEAPIKDVLVDPLAAVQWTFRIPNIISQKDLTLLTPQRRALFKNAFDTLSLGKIEQGESFLNEFLESSTSGFEVSLATATKGLLALIKNDGEQAHKLSHKAIEASTPAVSAYIIRSLVEQNLSNFDNAAVAAKLALEQDSNNGYALARLSELELGAGNSKRALALAQEAVQNSPQSPYSHVVLGYAYLTRYEQDKATKAFQDALSLDDRYGLAHLGLGLSLINTGELEVGREKIEQAVHLEPNRALYRSYLGKAFFEELDEDLAFNEYDMAIDLDPEDPTPYLYRAFNQLSNNRVPQALKDVEESIRLNDARAVYRSKLQLDQDLAVRTTSLSEVFTQLGFDQVARLEAIKSINGDYTNFAAHRLYADSLRGDFFADAQFTESIIADLLSPVSFNVFQNFNGFSPEASLNEFSALFDRPGHRGEYNFTGTNGDDLYQGSTIQTGKVGNFGYLASYATDYGRGRKQGGNYLRTHRFDLAGQYQLSYEDRIIVQSGYSSREDVIPGLENDTEDFEVSIGSHHKLSPNSEVITRFEYLNRNFDNVDTGVVEEALQEIVADGVLMPFDPTTLFLDQNTREDQRTLRGSIQHIFQNDALSAVTGAQYLYSRGDGDEESIITGDSSDFFTGLDRTRNSQGAFNTDSYSAYSYTTWHLTSFADLNLGLNFTEIQLPAFDVIAPFIDGARSENDILPKVGLTLYPTDGTIVRSAYFQTLGISNLSDIGTIEPTLVGSFNQNFGDLPGAKAENFGIGIDHKIPAKFYFGAEYIYRDIERDGIFTETLFTFDVDAVTDTASFVTTPEEESEKEHIINSYFYAVLSDSESATFDYQRILLEASDIGEQNDTDRVRVRYNYFSPLGWFAFAQTSYYHQFVRGVDSITDGSEEFWLVDAGLGYRLPKRHGSVQFVLKNILDQDFDFVDRGRVDPILNELAGVLQVSVNF